MSGLYVLARELASQKSLLAKSVEAFEAAVGGSEAVRQLAESGRDVDIDLMPKNVPSVRIHGSGSLSEHLIALESAVDSLANGLGSSVVTEEPAVSLKDFADDCDGAHQALVQRREQLEKDADALDAASTAVREANHLLNQFSALSQRLEMLLGDWISEHAYASAFLERVWGAGGPAEWLDYVDTNSSSIPSLRRKLERLEREVSASRAAARQTSERYASSLSTYEQAFAGACEEKDDEPPIEAGGVYDTGMLQDQIKRDPNGSDSAELDASVSAVRRARARTERINDARGKLDLGAALSAGIREGAALAGSQSPRREPAAEGKAICDETEPTYRRCVEEHRGDKYPYICPCSRVPGGTISGE